MSRSRNKHNNAIYYLFKTSITETDTTNEIENTTNQIGVPFQCKVENKVKGYRDAMSGVWQSTTLKILKTNAELDFEFGDKVSKNAYPSDGDYEFIQKAFQVEQYNRGGKHNKKLITEWQIEVS